MAKSNILTVDELIKLKTQIENRDSADFESAALGGTIKINKTSRGKFKSVISKLDKNSTDEEIMHVEDRLIYEHIPLLQDKKLQEAYEVKVPYDIVGRIFGDNAAEMDKISGIIYGFYGYNVEALKEAKKP